MDSPLCVAGGRGAGSSARVSVFSGPLQQGPAGSQVCQCGNQNWGSESNKHSSKPQEDTIAGCSLTSAWSRDAGMRADSPVSPLLFFPKLACSLGRLVDHCTMGEKEGRAVEVQAGQVKEEGNVIDAVERK